VSTNLAYLSLGSNIDPERNLRAAVTLLARYGQIRAVSTVLETPPLGYTRQANFLNAALLLETPLTAPALREEAIPAVESELGRVRSANKNGPRTIDIDIMLFNRDVLQMGHRHVPDPEVLERPYVTISLAEIAPDYEHPETGRTLQEIAAGLEPAELGIRIRSDVVLYPRQPTTESHHESG
jgi:2-amino-4-hydroxy-6-hydroxymethyldihydropteridine diphosphokinase